MVVVGVSVRADGGRTELVAERATTVDAIVTGVNSLLYLCPVEQRGAVLREVQRLAGLDPALIERPAAVRGDR